MYAVVVMSLQRFKVIRTALVAKGAVDPPVPFPNTVVKRSSTYNTAGSTSVGRSAAASAVLLFLFEQDQPRAFLHSPICALLGMGELGSIM